IKGFETVGSAQKVNAIIGKMLEQAAIKIQEQAKENCSADMGKLRGSISVEKISKGYAVGTNVEYGVYVEFGTGTLGDPSVPYTTPKYWRYKDKNGNWHTMHGMKPRPFLLPAFNRYKDKIPAAIKVNLSQALREAIRHG
ncbi:MAG: HK97 gp10 family phage protein, partial [Ruminiclostridium sp.]|nr:HK97 gp10 family phage protein [Ruminiclostridium sp.]